MTTYIAAVRHQLCHAHPGGLALRRVLGEEAKSRFTPFCKVEGYFEKRLGVNAKPYAIGFGIALPENWNGRYLFQGGGGLNGLIREPVGQVAVGDIPALFRGGVFQCSCRPGTAS